MSNAGGWQREKKAAERKESAETQDYESCQQNGMGVDRDLDKEEMSFVPGAVSDSVGWHEPRFMCDRHSGKDGFKFHDIASVMMEDDGEPHTRKPQLEWLKLKRIREEGTSGERHSMEVCGR